MPLARARSPRGSRQPPAARAPRENSWALSRILHRMRRAILLSSLCAIGLVAACGSRSDAREPREPIPSFASANLYETLRHDADSFTIAEGDWLEDLGDAPFYGLAFYARTEGPTSERARTSR